MPHNGCSEEDMISATNELRKCFADARTNGQKILLAMDANMENLERLAAAGDGESVLRFFESQGMSRDDIQRMMGGNDADTKEVLNFTKFIMNFIQTSHHS